MVAGRDRLGISVTQIFRVWVILFNAYHADARKNNQMIQSSSECPEAKFFKLLYQKTLAKELPSISHITVYLCSLY